VDKNARVERFHTEDGRIAERHISTNDAGEIVEELYIEDRRPLKLEKRVTKKHKEMLAEQRVETIKDGEVVEVQVQSVDAPPKLQVVNHIAKADKGEINPSNYISRNEIGPLVTDAVVAGVSAFCNNQVAGQSVTKPVFTSQAVVEERVETKKKTSVWIYAGFGLVIVVQIAVFGWVIFGN
jgi:hypothetical protein